MTLPCDSGVGTITAKRESCIKDYRSDCLQLVIVVLNWCFAACKLLCVLMSRTVLKPSGEKPKLDVTPYPELNTRVVLTGDKRTVKRPPTPVPDEGDFPDLVEPDTRRESLHQCAHTFPS